jgi:glycosyltransferase involved in cell wall biosynthesis
MPNLPTYVLVTPARNEARMIEATIQSVIAQTVLPLRWVIVSDGSTDGTDEIVSRYTAQYDWIELLRMPERSERNFAGKAYAFSCGKARLDALPYEVIANLDADITFESGYMAYLLGKLASDAALGVVGTPYVETNKETFDYHFVNIDHVSGACQVFRRACYEEIGGYSAIKVGTIDCVAVITARMKGWKTRTFTDMVCMHHRKMGTAQYSQLRARYNLGVMDYAMGNSPIWEFFRLLYQLTQKPYVIRGLAIGAGFVWSALRRAKRPVPPELVRFVRREQRQRLMAKLTGRVWQGSSGDRKRDARAANSAEK